MLEMTQDVMQLMAAMWACSSPTSAQLDTFHARRMPARHTLSSSDDEPCWIHVMPHTQSRWARGTDWQQSINQSINQFISRHSTEARATMQLCQIKEKCLKTDLKCANGWSSSTIQWKRVPKSRSSNREMMSSSVQVVWRNWQKL